jgi:UDP-N-acetylmuramate dehydrogenase
MISRVAKVLCGLGISCEQNVCVCQRCSFKLGGDVALAIYPNSQEQLASALRVLENADVKYEIIGNASNLLFAFDRYYGAFVFTEGLDSCRVYGEYIDCGAGVSLTYLANLAAKNSLSGLEFAYGIPGFAGGAIYMNAGAYGGQMSDVVAHTVALDRKTGQIIRLDECEFDYRQSIYMKNRDLVCLGATLKLALGEESEIRAKMAENMRQRKEKQPLELGSAGSYFKRPEGHFAGKLIEDCGLKGFSVGGAQVSEKHAGFIVNRGGANWRDVLELEKTVKERVAREFGVTLEREVRVITDQDVVCD